MGQFFSSSHLLHFFCHIIRKYLYTARLSLLHNETVFSPSKYIGYKCYICFIPGMGHFFSSSHLSTLVALFLLYHQKILFWSQFVSVCFAMKFFSSFKIHSLQMLQLFQTRNCFFFFIVTLVYTCRAFFALSSKNIYSIYCFGHSSSQSVLQ